MKISDCDTCRVELLNTRKTEYKFVVTASKVFSM